MSRIIVVPDVHGRTFWREVLNNTEDKIVFLGDYLDPYKYEGISQSQARTQLLDIIDFKKSNPNVTLLLGNHDIHYLYSSFVCSRFNSYHYYDYNKIFSENIDLFQMCVEIDNFIFTHAGISQAWLDHNNLTKENLVDNLNILLHTKPRIFHQVSYYRGGGYDFASPIWTDANEHNPFSIFDHKIQIFGHTQQDYKPDISGDMWCLDCRKIFVIENGELKEYKYE